MIHVGVFVLAVPAVQQLGHRVQRSHLHPVERVGRNVLPDQRELGRVPAVIVPVDARLDVVLGQLLQLFAPDLKGVCNVHTNCKQVC